MTGSFANKYAPERFSDVWGQDFAVLCLSNLIKRGQRGRNLLLHGSVGSGKTSLARLYARALNCLQPDENGSPCTHCRMCMMESAEAGFIEYDIAGMEPERRTRIRDVIAPFIREPTESRYTVIFFDEAHTFERAAADSLLKVIENPPKGVNFCFATTEAHQLRPALRSRLLDFEVRPLTPSIAIAFLQDIARREKIDYEPEALALLAGLKPRYPRDLITGLDLVHEQGERVTVARVREAFDVDHADRLVDYFFALADGDLAKQSRLLFDWHESAEDKSAWIQAFLTSLYYNDILSMDVVVDALSHSIKHERKDILGRFCQRLGLPNAEALEPYWRSLMEFWREAGADQGEHAIALRLALFQHRVNHPHPEMAHGAGSASLPPTAADNFDSDRALSWSAPTRKANDVHDQFFHRDNARELINRASYLIQFFGIGFNASFTINARSFGARTEVEACDLAREFCRDLDAILRDDENGENLALLVCFDRGEAGVFATVLAHIPARASQVDLPDWCEGWREASRQSRAGLAIRLKLSNRKLKNPDLKFHWNEVLGLCAGLDDAVEEWDAEQSEYRPLRELLKVRRDMLRPGRSIGMPRIIASGLLSDLSIAKHKRLHMAPLSAFDDKAWAEIRTGWELAEYRDRQRVLAQRCEQLKLVKATHGAVPALRFAKLMKTWPENARHRPRSWRLWGRGHDV